MAGCTVDRAGRTGIYAPTGGGPVLISRSTVSRATWAFNGGALDNVAARFNGQGITGLPSVIDGSEDQFNVVTP